MLTVVAVLAGLVGCRTPPAEGEIIDQVIILFDDHARAAQLRFGTSRATLPEGIVGPAVDGPGLPPEAVRDDVSCALLAGQGLALVAARFDRTGLCFFQDRVYYRFATIHVDGESARNECNAKVEGLSQEFGVGTLSLGLDDCHPPEAGKNRPAHCERKVRRAEDDDRAWHSVQVERFGPPHIRSEMTETVTIHGTDAVMQVTAFRTVPDQGDASCDLVLATWDPVLRAQATAAATPAADTPATP